MSGSTKCVATAVHYTLQGHLACFLPKYTALYLKVTSKIREVDRKRQGEGQREILNFNY